ncbi:MAG: hypothetical protein SV760_02975, partial [Halobacteria archaeon]|nr:hypothetical protein [Halobacteria archaeon]
MELNTRVLAGAALVLLVVAAGLIFLSDSPTQEKQAGLEERYSSVQSYEGTMVIKNRIVGDARRKWVQRVFENGTVENVTDPVEGEVLKVRNVTRPVRGPNGSRVRQTFRIRTVRVPNVVIRNRTVKADVAFRRGSPDVYRYDFVEGFLPPDDVRIAVVRGDEATLYYNSERNESTNASLVGIETLGLRYADFIPNLRQKYQVTEVGTRTVMGTQTR